MIRIIYLLNVYLHFSGMFLLLFLIFFTTFAQNYNYTAANTMFDHTDFDELFRLYYAELFLFARRFLAREADCEDMVSAAFEDVWRNFGAIEREAARAYLYKNVRNKCVDHLRRDATRRRHAELYARLSEGYDHADRMAELHEREQIVSRVLNSLPDYTRQIFTACYVDRKQYREVAEEMGISPNTVKKYISRALRLIAEQRKTP